MGWWDGNLLRILSRSSKPPKQASASEHLASRGWKLVSDAHLKADGDDDGDDDDGEKEDNDNAKGIKKLSSRERCTLHTSTFLVRSPQQPFRLKISTLWTLTLVPKSMASHGFGSLLDWQNWATLSTTSVSASILPSMHMAAPKPVQSGCSSKVEDIVAVTGVSSGSALKGNWPT